MLRFGTFSMAWSRLGLSITQGHDTAYLEALCILHTPWLIIKIKFCGFNKKTFTLHRY